MYLHTYIHTYIQAFLHLLAVCISVTFIRESGKFSILKSRFKGFYNDSVIV